ncbi:MAG: hypothetical protein Q8P22_12455, partial [Chloroflexota bacterium]|nr:hypothetical protein [Chloroflexota bacterium]
MGGSEAIRCRLIAIAVICLAIALAPACGDEQKAGLSIGRPSPTASPGATAFPSSTPEPALSAADGPSFTLVAVGDVMLGR